MLSDRFFERGRNFLNVEYPLISGAMTWISDPKLVSTVCNEGGFGCLAGGNMPAGLLERNVDETSKLTDKPFGVNLVTIAPAYKDQLSILKKKKLPFVIFAGSFPREKEVDLAKESGAKVLCFASTLSIAHRMLGYGVDGLILEGMEAGGHVGHVSLTILLQQVLFEVPGVPIFVAGGIATGRMCAHLLLMGAAGVQFGTLFAVAEESCAHPDFKNTLIKSNARDSISTPQFDSRLPVVAVRALRNKGIDEFGKLQLELIKKMDEGKIGRLDAQKKVEEYWMGALRRAAIEGNVSNGSLMAGQSVGLVDRCMSVKDIIHGLVQDIDSELINVKELLKFSA
ncbi:MAG: nitronate monooxygenase family protein [Candidatus Theseobacter exili]|nr:nitronate monooxygenase family protein [Candidatus Theseobacter exili]